MEKRIEKVRARLARLASDYMQETVTDAYNELGRMSNEIERLREGLKLITCEPINAEYMAQNILDGLPAYHDTMMDCAENCKCKAAVPPEPTLHQKIRSAQIAAGEDAVIANLRSMGLACDCGNPDCTGESVQTETHNAEVTGA